MITDVFCKIIKGELPKDVVIEDDDFIVIKDINPQTPVHLVVVTKRHFTGLADINDERLIGRGLLIAHKAAEKIGIAEKGYRLIINEGEDGGKLVPHLHIHLLGGKKLGPKIVK